MVLSPIMHDDQAVFIVATVPPPPGESDAYSAATKLQGPPLAMIAAMMDNVVDFQLRAVEVEEEVEEEDIVDVEVAEEVPVEKEEEHIDVDFTDVASMAPVMHTVEMQPVGVQQPSQQPFALVLAGIATIVGGAIAAISFLV